MKKNNDEIWFLLLIFGALVVLVIFFWYIFLVAGLVWAGIWLHKNKFKNDKQKKKATWISIGVLSLIILSIGIGPHIKQEYKVSEPNTTVHKEKSKDSKSNTKKDNEVKKKKSESKKEEKTNNAQDNSTDTETSEDSSSDNNEYTQSASPAPTDTSEQQSQSSSYTTQGSIIGNANSRIYHVPGQAGYHINPSNAVYFQTEQEAQASGYRRALR
ncbi:sunset domain-containing protein [Companilactobacillus metriopterae]|uniref:sunset domain-containing protein n=1 Tax=Companilactobacillus metriopterae TaxID=1909267 RepID=UPI00100BCBC8|nr:hypothetical protein [Companilactobacillus metriopterae]